MVCKSQDVSFWTNEEFTENNLCEVVREIAGKMKSCVWSIQCWSIWLSYQYDMWLFYAYLLAEHKFAAAGRAQITLLAAA